MGATNTLRSWVAALKAGYNRVDLLSGEAIKILPQADDTGSIQVGDGTYDMDFSVFLGNTSDKVLFDVGNKAVTVGGATVVNVPDGQLQLNSTAITATAAELNRATDTSARVVTTTATTLSLTVTQHGDRIVLVNTNSTVENAVTLPGATGSGVKFTVVNNIVQTQGSVTVKVTGSEVMKGQCLMCDSTEETAKGFGTATATKINFNLTTTGGVTAGDMVEAWDTAQSVWTVRVTSCGSGNLATPFS